MLNTCSFIGNLGADPEVRTLGSGDKVVNLRLAVSERWKDKASGEWREKTEWVPIAIFNQPLANRAQQALKKGSKVYVSGAFQTRKWTDKEGNERYTTEIVIQAFNGQLIPLDPRQQSDSFESAAPKNKFPGRDSHNQAKASGYQPDIDLGDEVPF